MRELIKLYMEDIQRFPLLNEEEEIALAKRIAAGDAEAKKELVNSNLRLVVKIANGYYSDYLDMMDIIQEGNKGLLKAADRYDYTKGKRFATYAYPAINNTILREVIKAVNRVYIPEDVSRLINQYEKLVKKESRELDIEEIQEHFGVTREKAMNIKFFASLKGISLNEKVGDHESEVGQFVEDEKVYYSDNILNKVYFENKILSVAKVMELKPNELRILFYRYGITGESFHTCSQTAEHFNESENMGLTASRVRLIEMKVIKEIRKQNNQALGV